MSDADFLDFRMIVNKVADDGGDNFVIVIAEAPISSPGYRFDRLGRGENLERLLQRLATSCLVRDLQGNFRLHWNVPAEPAAADRDAQPVQQPVSMGHQLTEVGRALFWLLFPEQSNVYHAFGRSCQCANREDKFLRLRLELPPELANIPWELMQWPQTGMWVEEISKARVSLVRYLGNIDGWQASPGRPCVIVVKANPKDVSNARLTQSFYSERRQLEELFRRNAENVDFDVIEEPAMIRILRERIDQLNREGRSVIGFHFIGHGGVDDNGGYLLWEDDLIHSQRIYEAELRWALDGAKSLRWIIFNACNSAHQPTGTPLAGLATSMALLKNVPTVIAYQRPVETKDAEALASEFYKLVLEDRQPIESVVRNIQQRYRNPGGLVVLMRSVNGEIQSTLPFMDDRGAPAPDSGAAANQAERDAEEKPRDKQEKAHKAGPEKGAEHNRPENTSHQKAEGPSVRTRPSKQGDLGEMVLVPGGPFKKGLSPKQIDALISQFRRQGLNIDLDSAREVLSEEREEEIVLPDFLIDITPVTNAEFRRFIDATGHITEAEQARAPQNWRLYDQPDKAEHPVVFVSHNDALAYCRWAGKRLPTADEWKKAYRGPEGKIYPWGDEFDVHLCNTAESQHGWETTPVKRFPKGRSVYGCYDMVGNVEEWTSTPGPRGSRVVLGGSWCMTCQVYGLPVLERYAATTFYSNEQGFRCAKDAPE
jgi:formylglycine-generating enzyme required for sulfatase activity